MELIHLNNVASQIKTLMHDARLSAVRELSNRLLKTYWEIGRIIVEHEQDGNVKAQYGTRLLAELSKELTRDLGRGFSRSNLQCMRNFYLAFPNLPDASGKLGSDSSDASGLLTWSHCCELTNVSDVDARAFYQQECMNSRWSVRELKRQIGTSLFERLLLSDGKANKEAVLALARQGVAMSKPEDILKDPYVFEFLGANEKKPLLERDLERKLIRHIEDFLLELGRGFMFVGS